MMQFIANKCFLCFDPNHHALIIPLPDSRQLTFQCDGKFKCFILTGEHVHWCPWLPQKNQCTIVIHFGIDTPGCNDLTIQPPLCARICFFTINKQARQTADRLVVSVLEWLKLKTFPWVHKGPGKEILYLQGWKEQILLIYTSNHFRAKTIRNDNIQREVY